MPAVHPSLALALAFGSPPILLKLELPTWL
jgi:hypothetical protein